MNEYELREVTRLVGESLVDLSKFAAVLGSSFDPIARYRALLAFCESRPSGFAEPAAWYRKMLARLEAPASAKAPAAAVE